MTSGFFSSNGDQGGRHTQEGRVTCAGCACALMWDSSNNVDFMNSFRKLLTHLRLVKKRLVRQDVKTSNGLMSVQEQPVCLRQHIFLRR